MQNVNLTLRYEKCFCCNKNHSITQLIDLDANSVIIGDENILLFSDLILDSTSVLIDNDGKKYICGVCKDMLISFHLWKRDIKKYDNFQKHITMTKILHEIETNIVSTFDADLSNLTIKNVDDTIIISQHELLETEEIKEVVTTEEDEINECNEEELLENEEYIDETDLNETIQSIDALPPLNEKSIFHADSTDCNEEISLEGSPRAKRRKKYVYKTNTNEDLTVEQVEWIRQQVKKSEMTAKGKRVYRCQICGKVLQIVGSLKKHLRDTHILKSCNQREEKDSKTAFKDEIRSSKIEIETNDGAIETIYKCQRCKSSRVFRSEGGIVKHLRYFHIRNQVIDAQFVSKCKITIETENGTLKNAWQCAVCEKILKSRDGLRNHMKLEHTESIEQFSQGNREVENALFENSCSLNESDVLLSQTEALDKNLLLQLAMGRRQFSNTASSPTCEQCGIVFKSGTTKKEKSSEIHQQLHIILKAIAESYAMPLCEKCKVMFSNVEDLNIHLIQHDLNEVFDAEGLSLLVAKKFKDPIGTAEFEDQNAWKCGHCSNTHFAEKHELILHQLLLHSKYLICPFDFLEFNGVRGLSQFASHMKNKHPEMFPELKICCSYCGEEFSNVFDKLGHMKSCSNKQYACDHCSKTFFKKTQLIRHLKIVSGVISFVCETCSKKCVSSMDLKLHTRVHTNEKTYQCKFTNCFKVFKTPSARTAHVEIHSEIKYECSACKAIFKQRNLLQKHLKKGLCKVSRKQKSPVS